MPYNRLDKTALLSRKESIIMERKLQVITGGTSGMGLAAAKALSVYGPVLIGGRSEKRLANALAELKEAGVEAYGMPCDVSDKASLKAFAEYALTIAPIGNVINAAGVDYANMPKEPIIKINMLGTHYVLETFLPYLDDSYVVNFSSITGNFYPGPSKEEKELWDCTQTLSEEEFVKRQLELTAQPMDPRMVALGDSYMTYAMSKRYVQYYTQAKALRVAMKNNSRIISIAPGSFYTPMLAEGNNEAMQASIKRGTVYQRFGTSEEMADLIVHLLAPGHGYLTGVDIIHDGGKTALSFAKQMM